MCCSFWRPWKSSLRFIVCFCLLCLNVGLILDQEQVCLTSCRPFAVSWNTPVFWEVSRWDFSALFPIWTLQPGTPLSVCQSACLSVCLSVCLPVCQSVSLPTCLSVCQSTCLSVCLSVCRCDSTCLTSLQLSST